MYEYLDSNGKAVALKNIEDGSIIEVTIPEFQQLYRNNRVIMNRNATTMLTERLKKLKGATTGLSRTPESGIHLYAKTELDIFLKVHLEGIKKSRDFVQQLKTSREPMIVLSGVRRTGKTTGLLQYVRYLRNKRLPVCYITLAKEISFDILYTFLRDNCFSYDYVCIDEITRCRNFISNASPLADDFAYRKRKLIVTGTDSIALDLATGSSLFMRVGYINTSIILYSEYKRILGYSFLEYMQSASLYRPERINFENVHKLMSLTLCENMANTLQRNNESTYTPAELKYYIFTLIAKQVIASYSVEPMTGDTPTCDDETRKKLRKEATNILLSRLLKTQNNVQFKQSKMEEVRSKLTSMGVLFDITNVYPTEINSYCTIVAIPGINYSLLHEYNTILQQMCEELGITIKQNNGVLGHIYECLVISNLRKMGYSTYFCRSADGSFEIDVVVKTNKGVYLFEVKGKNKKEAKDFRHLRNKEAISRYFGNVSCKKFVLYMGETENKSNDCYINIEDFLLDTKKFIQ